MLQNLAERFLNELLYCPNGFRLVQQYQTDHYRFPNIVSLCLSYLQYFEHEHTKQINSSLARPDLQPDYLDCLLIFVDRCCLGRTRIGSNIARNKQKGDL